MCSSKLKLFQNAIVEKKNMQNQNKEQHRAYKGPDHKRPMCCYRKICQKSPLFFTSFCKRFYQQIYWYYHRKQTRLNRILYHIYLHINSQRGVKFCSTCKRGAVSAWLHLPETRSSRRSCHTVPT